MSRGGGGGGGRHLHAATHKLAHDEVRCQLNARFRFEVAAHEQHTVGGIALHADGHPLLHLVRRPSIAACALTKASNQAHAVSGFSVGQNTVSNLLFGLSAIAACSHARPETARCLCDQRRTQLQARSEHNVFVLALGTSRSPQSDLASIHLVAMADQDDHASGATPSAPEPAAADSASGAQPSAPSAVLSVPAAPHAAFATDAGGLEAVIPGLSNDVTAWMGGRSAGDNSLGAPSDGVATAEDEAPVNRHGFGMQVKTVVGTRVAALTAVPPLAKPVWCSLPCLT